MQRGEVRLIDLEPTRGSGANKRRPGVIVSNDRANATADRLGRGVVTVVPVTRNIVRVVPFQVLLPANTTDLRVDSKAQAEQVCSVAIERIGPVLRLARARWGNSSAHASDRPGASTRLRTAEPGDRFAPLLRHGPPVVHAPWIRGLPTLRRQSVGPEQHLPGPIRLTGDVGWWWLRLELLDVPPLPWRLDRPRVVLPADVPHRFGRTHAVQDC